MFSFGGLDEALKLLRVCWSVSALKILDCEANLLFPVLPPAVCRQSRTLFFFFFLWLFLLFGLSACSWRTNRTTAGIILRQQRAALPATAIKVASRTKTVNKTTSCYEVKRTNSNSWQSTVASTWCLVWEMNVIVFRFGKVLIAKKQRVERC